MRDSRNTVPSVCNWESCHQVHFLTVSGWATSRIKVWVGIQWQDAISNFHLQTTPQHGVEIVNHATERHASRNFWHQRLSRTSSILRYVTNTPWNIFTAERGTTSLLLLLHSSCSLDVGAPRVSLQSEVNEERKSRAIPPYHCLSVATREIRYHLANLCFSAGEC